ncbi:hypothetical protein [Pontibacter ramchanderi]|uniref:hypothetical protein n=1 Tax=Pontibacter ramchanderi TaxID=1179743 RepID=UPI0015D65819
MSCNTYHRTLSTASPPGCCSQLRKVQSQGLLRCVCLIFSWPSVYKMLLYQRYKHNSAKPYQ